MGALDCLLFELGDRPAAQTDVNDFRPVVDGIINPAINQQTVRFAFLIRGLNGHNDRAGVDPGDADTVIIFGGDDTGNERPVAADVGEVVVLIQEIPTVDIVNEAVVVVINAVTGDFFGIFPDILRRVRMGHVQARIDDGDNDIFLVRVNDIPRRIGIIPWREADFLNAPLVFNIQRVLLDLGPALYAHLDQGTHGIRRRRFAAA